MPRFERQLQVPPPPSRPILRFRGTALATLFVILLAGSTMTSAAGWTELGGGPDRGGTAELPRTPLDVVAFRSLAVGREHLDARYLTGMVSTPHGVAAFLTNASLAASDPSPGATCRLILLRDPRSGPSDTVYGDSCPYGGMAGTGIAAYDAATDSLLICKDARADEPFIQSRDARSGRLRWELAPSALGAVALPRTEGQRAFADVWYCGGVAVNPATGEGIVPVQIDAGSNRVAAVDLASGALSWVTEISQNAFIPAGGVLPREGRDPVTIGGFQASTVTVTSTGIVVAGTFGSAVRSAAVAWLDFDGNLVGGATSEPGDSADSTVGVTGSEWAASWGPRAAIALGNRGILIDPESGSAGTIIPLPGAASVTGREWAGTAWWQDTLVIPRAHDVLVMDVSGSPDPWSWNHASEWTVKSVVLTPPDTLHVLAIKEGRGSPEAAVFRVDLTARATVQSIPLPWTRWLGDAADLAGSTSRLMPLPDGTGLLAWSPFGEIAVLADAASGIRPAIEVSNLYPEPGDTVTVAITPGPEVRTRVKETRVAWGEGAPETVAGGAVASHVFAGDGTRRVHVTHVLVDGRTATTDVLVRVGATPPAALTFLQRAFSAEEQERTFFALGVAGTMAGSLLAFGIRARKRSRLSRELDELARIRRYSAKDAAGALQSLADFRNRVTLDLGKGRMDDSQFSVLDMRASALLVTLRQRALEAVRGRLSPDFLHRLDVALEDGRLAPEEVGDLESALDIEEGLDASERSEVARLVRGLGEDIEPVG